MIISQQTPKTIAKFAFQDLDPFISRLAAMINTIFRLVNMSPSVILDKAFPVYSSSGETSEKDQHIEQKRFTKSTFNK